MKSDSSLLCDPLANCASEMEKRHMHPFGVLKDPPCEGPTCSRPCAGFMCGAASVRLVQCRPAEHADRQPIIRRSPSSFTWAACRESTPWATPTLSIRPLPSPLDIHHLYRPEAQSALDTQSTHTFISTLIRKLLTDLTRPPHSTWHRAPARAAHAPAPVPAVGALAVA